MRLAIIALGLVVGGCGNDGASSAPLGGPVDAGPCLPGASAADCQKCTYGANACDVACPEPGESIHLPIPAEYQHACSVHSCCICEFDTWSSAPLVCETDCDALARQWRAIASSSAVVACTRREDCNWIEGPETCNCAPTISGDCAFAVNVAAYQASGAPAIASTFHASACKYPNLCDCGPPRSLDCVDGVCKIGSFYSCF